MSGSVLAEDSRHMLVYVTHNFDLLEIVQALVICSQKWMKGSTVTQEQTVGKSRDQSSGLKLSYFEPHYIVTGNGKEACSHLREAVCCSALIYKIFTCGVFLAQTAGWCTACD